MVKKVLLKRSQNLKLPFKTSKTGLFYDQRRDKIILKPINPWYKQLHFFAVAVRPGWLIAGISAILSIHLDIITLVISFNVLTYIHTYTHIHTHTHTYIHTHTSTHTQIHTYIHTYRQTDRQTDRQTGRHRHTNRPTKFGLYRVYIISRSNN